jgi:hypothetical protein
VATSLIMLLAHLALGVVPLVGRAPIIPQPAP